MTPASTQQRAHAKREAVGVVDNLVEVLTIAGFHGTLPLELELHDGVVTIVRSKGAEQTFKIVGRKAAA